MVKRNTIATKLTKICTQTQNRAFDVVVRRLHEETILTLHLPELRQALPFQESGFASTPIFQVVIAKVLDFI